MSYNVKLTGPTTPVNLNFYLQSNFSVDARKQLKIEGILALSYRGPRPVSVVFLQYTISVDREAITYIT